MIGSCRMCPRFVSGMVGFLRSNGHARREKYFLPLSGMQGRERGKRSRRTENTQTFKFRLTLSGAGVGSRYYGASFDNYRVSREEEGDVVNAVRSYADNFSRNQSPNVVMHGNTGTGKTHLPVLLRAGYFAGACP